MLTPSNLKKHGYPYDFTLRDGETKEQSSDRGNYAIRATRIGNTVVISKRFALGNFYPNNQLSYEAYLNQLNQPHNYGSLIEAF
jgi:hypothetical protein